jgi:ATP-dependent RNA helicase DHX29
VLDSSPHLESFLASENAETQSPPSQEPPVLATDALSIDELKDEEIVISDLESDLEPDQLISAYLKIKGRLFELEPDLLQPKKSKSKTSNSRSSQSMANTPGSAATRKLLLQLQQLESDALFDPDEAESQWPAFRNRIAQQSASKRQKKNQTSESSPARRQDASNPAEKEVENQDSANQDEDEGCNLLGDMFGAIPDEPAMASQGGSAASGNDTILKDFGKYSGLAPRRILEEAVRAR